MDLHLTEDQQALVAALQDIMGDHQALPQDERFSYAWHDAALQSLLAESGFLDAGRDIGPLEAALVTFEVAKGISAIDTIGAGLVAPLTLPSERFAGPVALVAVAGLDKAIRNLPIAGTLLVDCGDDVVVLPVDAAAVESVESVYAFPYGRFAERPDLAGGKRFAGAGAAMRRWWRVGIAAEIAGAARASIDFTIDYVKQRHVFGRPVGSFQSVQHRLVQRHGWAKSLYYLAMRGAWSERAIDADIAACHAQLGIQALLFDLHQFHGGMGVTTEHLLHFWTYRIRALQAEAGGLHNAALAIAAARWAESAPALAEAPVRATA
ncbi:acyl-CoA dehydrogenase family protein [Sphingomonas sp. ID0503]|uniref:acyl-CoA dehydrogenase family protein n=1 Tax=Sphingomonas sp. ID0503 TaxID=3399691 RepID=UPI003AFACD0B